MRVLVVTGDHRLPDSTKWDGAYTEGDLELHRTMQDALDSLPGYEFEFLTDHARLIPRLSSDPPDLVLNFCDTGFGNVAAQELHVPALLELFGVPYSGAGPTGMVLCYDKAVVREVAEALAVAVPNELYLPAGAWLDPADVRWPALIKPVRGDGSVGIRENAVVRDVAEAERYLDRFRRDLPGCAALVQEFLPGAEYGLALVGNPASGFTVFPPLEVDYAALPAGLPPILAFESKTGPPSPYDRVRIRPARIDDGRLDEMRQSAELLFERLDCRDYARFDFRTGADGGIRLLEVNPNPAWSAGGKLARMAGFGGTSYPALLRLILETARARLAL